MSIEKGKAYFKSFGLEERVIELSQSSATVSLAAKALEVGDARIAKTLSFLVDDQAILVVVAGDARIYSGNFKREFQTKPKMLQKDLVEKLIGHDVGGVCPFAINEGVKVYLDISLKRFKTVFPAVGSDNSAIELTILELEKYSNNVKWVDVCKDWK